MADLRDIMSRFLMGVSDLVEEECHIEMLLHDINISRFMVYSQQIDESKHRKNNREIKKSKTSHGNFSNVKSDGRHRPKSKPRYFYQDYSNTSWFDQDKSSGSPLHKPTCTKCGRNYYGKCLADTEGCYGCGKSGHKMRYCLVLMA